VAGGIDLSFKLFIENALKKNVPVVSGVKNGGNILFV
jgi:hypothetical protein